ncbi:MAG: hypothetical protein SFX18_17450 [Pirellulales bacterium]|nr:hypothetical protein [Pirellulales bacterium]
MHRSQLYNLAACYWPVPAVAIWLVAVIFGMGIVAAYHATPGPLTSPPLLWPRDGGISRSDGDYQLLMFAHPHCPCMRASLNELAAVISRSPTNMSVRIYFMCPGNNTHWGQGNIVQQARGMTRVAVCWDRDGQIATHFGAQTAGHVLLYGKQGELLFSGGITAARGHEGQNAGRAAIISLVNGESAALTRTPVFGCPLLDPKTCAIVCGANP